MIGPHFARAAGHTKYGHIVPPRQTQSYLPSTHRLPRDSALGVSLNTYGVISSPKVDNLSGIPLSARDSPLAVEIRNDLIGIIRFVYSLMSFLETMSKGVPESISHVSMHVG